MSWWRKIGEILQDLGLPPLIHNEKNTDFIAVAHFCNGCSQGRQNYCLAVYG